MPHSTLMLITNQQLGKMKSFEKILIESNYWDGLDEIIDDHNVKHFYKTLLELAAEEFEKQVRNQTIDEVVGITYEIKDSIGLIRRAVNIQQLRGLKLKA